MTPDRHLGAAWIGMKVLEHFKNQFYFYNNSI